MKPVHIVVDANIIIGTGYGSNHQFRELLSTLEDLPHDLCIPKVVIEEVIGKFSRDFDDDAREIRSRLRDLSRRLGKDLSSTVNDLDKANEVSSFRERLEAQFDRILDYPDTRHELLVRRATTRIRPFDEEGDGYRDALIWETVLILAEEDDSSEDDAKVVLISNDNDFRNQKRELHNDLSSQIEERGLSLDRVILFSTLGEFITHLQSGLPEVPLE